MKTDYIEIHNSSKTTIFATLALDEHGNIASEGAVKTATRDLKKAFPGCKIIVNRVSIHSLSIIHDGAVVPQRL